MAPVSIKKFFDIQANIECKFNLKCVRDMKRTYSQMHHNTLNHLSNLSKCLSVSIRAKLLWDRVLLELLKLQISCLFGARSSLTFRQI